MMFIIYALRFVSHDCIPFVFMPVSVTGLCGSPGQNTDTLLSLYFQLLLSPYCNARPKQMPAKWMTE